MSKKTLADILKNIEMMEGQESRDFDEKIAELRVMQEAYANPCPFRPGDLVTPRAKSDMKGTGEPHIVLEVLDTPIDTMQNGAETASNGYGRRLNVRILCFVGNGQAAPFWTESWQLEPWAESVE